MVLVGPKVAQDGPKLAGLGVVGPSMGPTWAQLRPNIAPTSRSRGSPKRSWNEAGLEDGFRTVLVFFALGMPVAAVPNAMLYEALCTSFSA